MLVRRKLISTRTHGIIDYASVAVLLLLPWVLGWSDRITLLLTMAAFLTLLFSSITRYEYGVFEIIPMQGHLMFQFGFGVIFLGAAVLLYQEPPVIRAFLAGYGAFAITLSLITETEPPTDRR